MSVAKSGIDSTAVISALITCLSLPASFSDMGGTVSVLRAKLRL
jgi:hypothetical protein